jgi:hypothetical protein
MKKHHLFATVIVALSAFTFAGCANNQPTTAAANRSNDNPSRKVYTQHDLERSGESDTGRALQKIDPDVTAPR